MRYACRVCVVRGVFEPLSILRWILREKYSQKPQVRSHRPDETRADVIALVFEFPPHCKSHFNPGSHRNAIYTYKLVPSGHQFAVHYLNVKFWDIWPADG